MLSVILYAAVQDNLATEAGPMTQSILHLGAMAITGSHSSVLAGFVCFSLICVAPASAIRVDADITFVMFVIEVVVWSAHTIVEYRSAKLQADWDEERNCTAMLLDNASDGFCCVDCVSGAIVSASHQLQTTFSEHMEGMQFLDFVQQQDRPSFQNLCHNTMMDRRLEPILVTCQSHLMTVDIKLIPYAISGERLHLCLQIQGEVRANSIAEASLAVAGDDATLVEHPQRAAGVSKLDNNPDWDRATTMTYSVSVFNQENPPATGEFADGPSTTNRSTVMHADVGTQTDASVNVASRHSADGPGRPPILGGSSNSSIAPQINSQAAMLVSLFSAMKQWQMSEPGSDVKCCVQHMMIRLAQRLLKQERQLPCLLLRRHFRLEHGIDCAEPGEILTPPHGGYEEKEGGTDEKEKTTVLRPPRGRQQQQQQEQGKSKQPKRLTLNSSKRVLPHFKETPLTTVATLLANSL